MRQQPAKRGGSLSRAGFRHCSLKSVDSAAGGAVSCEDEAGARSLGDQLATFVLDGTVDVTGGPPSLDDNRFGGQLCRPDRAEEDDAEFGGGERLAGLESASQGHSQSRVRAITQTYTTQ